MVVTTSVANSSISETSDDDDESRSLHIVVDDSPRKVRTPRKRRKCIEIGPEERALIEPYENKLEQVIEEKATKAKLTQVNVKNILKQLCSNEQVLQLVKSAENNEPPELEYEPKLTRSKTKELFSESKPVIKQVLSETQVLISEELPEDEDDDEYVPGDCDGSDLDTSTSSLEPPTPQSADCGTQTQWSEDGCFKLPQTKEFNDDEGANVAKRTRSKVSLTDTPLEKIEEAFVPPDIPNDLYDVECDDDDWMNFLKAFTKPLDEVIKCTEDEEQDPEYNVLADEIDIVDREELRDDKGVKITQKELNALISELCVYAENYDSYFYPSQSVNYSEEPSMHEIKDQQSQPNYDNTAIDNSTPAPAVLIQVLDTPPEPMTSYQRSLLAQQIRQHIQLLTQSFLLCYQHPEQGQWAVTLKKCLMSLKEMGSENSESIVNVCNLNDAVNLVNSWEAKLSSNDADAVLYKQQVSNEMSKLEQICEKKFYSYQQRFPDLFLKTVTSSKVFLYPSLLPELPIRSKAVIKRTPYWSLAEIRLLILGLEQFLPYAQYQKAHRNSKGTVYISHVAYYINKYLMPARSAHHIGAYISHEKSKRDSIHPIRKYFEYGYMEPIEHNLICLDEYKILPPIKRNKNELQGQWRRYVAKESKKEITSNKSKYTKKAKTRFFCSTRSPRPGNKKQVPACSTRKSGENYKSSNNIPSAHTPIFSRFDASTHDKSATTNDNSAITTLVKFEDYETLSMVKFNSEILHTARTSMEDQKAINNGMPVLEGNVESEQLAEMDGQNATSEKESSDDINNLTSENCTAKGAGKKQKSSAPEKRKAKLKRDMNASLKLLDVEDEKSTNDKTDRFVHAFYDKIQEHLDVHEWHQFLEAMYNHDIKKNTPTELYMALKAILSPKHPDLLEECLLLFTSDQVKNIGKLMPFMLMKNMQIFIQKLEMYYRDQPPLMRKVFRVMSEMAQMEDITMVQVKTLLLPFLKSSPLLVNWFYQIFPFEKPPESLLNNAWETVEIGKENSFSAENCYELLTLPDVEDPYGGPTCICACHNVEEQDFKSRMKHCTPCGIKFMQGRVYVTVGKTLRPAKISFGDNSSIDHFARLSPHPKNKRNDTPVKKVSPGKDSQDDRLSSDEEPEKKRRMKGSKKRKAKKEISIEEANISDKDPKVELLVNNEVFKNEETKLGKDEEEINLDIDNNVDDNSSASSPSSINEVKNVEEIEPENIEWDCNTSVEGSEVRTAIDNFSCESESVSEFCEETSQDNTDTESGMDSESNSPAPPEYLPWTRDEDKIILQTLQKEEDKERAFQKISEILEHRTLQQIIQRFDMLLNILQKMSR